MTPTTSTTQPQASLGRPQTLADILRRPRYELLPLDGIEDAVLASVPTDVKLTVTASPRKGLDATIELSERLARHGYPVVPHLSARLVRDAAHLRDVLTRLHEAGVRELFVPAGDADEPAGAFDGSAALLSAMGDLRGQFTDIGITGYPESHHLISDDMTILAMAEKAHMATCVISQICFDAQTITSWIERIRARGVLLPVWVGLPGVVDQAKLIRISMKIGLGESTRFLRNHRSWLSQAATRQFKPDKLIKKLEPRFADARADIGGFHMYTFNEVAATERWRQELLARLEG